MSWSPIVVLLQLVALLEPKVAFFPVPPPALR